MSAGKAIPTSCFRPHLKPFWNRRLTELKVIKVAKLKKWVSEGRPRVSTSIVWIEHKAAKKAFTREIKRVSKEYENRQMNEAIY